MGDVFSVRRSVIARDVAVERVRAASSEFQTKALATIHQLASLLEDFTTDDVWQFLGRGSEEGRAMGAAMLTAASLGYIERTNETRKSARVACHRRDLRVWRSLLRRQ